MVIFQIQAVTVTELAVGRGTDLNIQTLPE
jgi:hypothetical protein